MDVSCRQPLLEDGQRSLALGVAYVGKAPNYIGRREFEPRRRVSIISLVGAKANLAKVFAEQCVGTI